MIWQSRIDNPDTPLTIDTTRHKTNTNKTKKDNIENKKMSNMDPTTNRKESSSCYSCFSWSRYN